MELLTTSNTSTNKTPSCENQPVENILKLKDRIPAHLREFIVEQDTTHYLPIDHATWRYSLRQLSNYLKDNAHECYLDGLVKTGITLESIPSIDDICQKLNEFGWSAVPVSGFIPPAAFMEMQSLGILPIASDMRSNEHVLYTPAPDIVHEAAGHAPILIHPDFAAYLKEYASVAKKAIVSSEDLALYEAIRELSDIKESPESSDQEIASAEQKLSDIVQSMTVTSEATLLGRMNWWTAEYGLIGELNDPKIYGAGLLSSYGEARECLSDKVKKLPLTVDCVNYTYDITEPQPQLFVARSFTHLKEVLLELSKTMAYKKGGLFGVRKAIEAKTVNTVQLNSGLQVSGKVVEELNSEGECIYFRCEGPSQLCVGGQQLEGHDKDFHSHGYSSPVGFVDGLEDCLSWASHEDLTAAGIVQGESVTLRFESGVIVKGVLVGMTRTRRSELCLLSFKDCHVTYNSKILFQPDWGQFDMAVGSKIESVFSGPADRKAYGLTDSFAQKRVPKRELSENEKLINQIYGEIRQIRENGTASESILQALGNRILQKCPEQWLALLELAELAHGLRNKNLIKEFETQLMSLRKGRQDLASVIDDGLKLASQK
ncbi:MAG: aromatic amino acid hydroxylase [Pseudomonadota bacterium]